MRELERLANARAFFYPECDAAGHECSIERNRNIVLAGGIAETVVRLLASKSEKFAQHDAGIGCIDIAPARFISPVDDSDPACLNARQSRHNAFRADRLRKRLGLAHQRTQVGVFPFLDATMR